MRLWERIAEIKRICGGLPEELIELEHRLERLMDVKAKARASILDSGEEKEDCGVWGTLTDLILHTDREILSISEHLKNSKDRFTKTKVLYAKSLLASVPDTVHTIQRLSKQLQIILAAINNLSTTAADESTRDINELLKVLICIRDKRDMELEEAFVNLKLQLGRTPSRDIATVDVGDGSDLEKKLASLARRNSVKDFGKTIKASVRRASTGLEKLNLDPSPEEVLLTRDLAPRVNIQVDEGDLELLKATMRLRPKSTMLDIQGELQRIGMKVNLVAIAHSGFLEVQTDKKTFGLATKSKLKPRWVVHFPDTMALMVFKSPYDLESRPEKMRVPLGEVALIETGETSSEFVLVLKSKQSIRFKADSESTAMVWRHRILDIVSNPPSAKSK